MCDPNIQTIYKQYQRKYPLYTMGAIVDLMLDDGVITFDIAEKFKSGTSLFLIDNKFCGVSSVQSDLSITNILGGNFNTSKKIPTTNFNRRVELTFQSEKQGDCWLLSDINSLNLTDWGRKAIEDAIIPDTDGSGGVTIRFKGSPLKQKNIHITAYQIEQARNSGNYTKEDDDVIAFELATEKTFKEMVQRGMAKRNATDEELQDEGLNYRSFIFYGISTKEYHQYPISKLLGIPSTELNFLIINGYNSYDPIKETNKILKFLSEQKNNITMWCSFYGDSGNKIIHGNHAYAVKKMEYGKTATLIDPMHPDKNIILPWNDFVCLIKSAKCSYNRQNLENQIKQYLPKYYDEKNEEYNKRFNKS